jgi:hypothetical protein
MSCWLTIPSARPPEEAEKVLKLWKERGYKIALWRDNTDCDSQPVNRLIDLGFTEPVYPGYAVAVNGLIEMAQAFDSSAEWFVAAGDDIEPDLNHSAEEIAEQCRFHFEDLHGGNAHHETFGVMQPTGDRWQDTPRTREMFGENRGALIDRVCGSAWIGREFARRAYGGKGPLFPGYQHMFVDEELQAVATKLGVLWQRRDLIQLHRHVLRPQTGDVLAVDTTVAAHLYEHAPHLVKWNTKEHWDESKKLFEERKRAGFPGHEPS